MKLQYKTRGMSEPKGKPKVYFSCHPEDFELYFEPISKELLAIEADDHGENYPSADDENEL